MSAVATRIVYSFSCIGEVYRAKGVLVARCERHAKLVLMDYLARKHPQWHDANLTGGERAMSFHKLCDAVVGTRFTVRVLDHGE